MYTERGCIATNPDCQNRTLDPKRGPAAISLIRLTHPRRPETPSQAL